MPAKNKKKSQSTVETPAISTTNAFASLGPHTEAEEKKEHRERQSKTHEEIDKIWKFLKAKRQSCRSLQYQFWAAVLIEKENLSKEDGGLKKLIESILIDARMGDHHIARLPAQYHDKMRLCTVKIFLEDKKIEDDVNKYAEFLEKWYSDLIQKIKDQIGNDYIAEDESGKKYVINSYREIIKEIIKNDPLAQKIRQELNLSERIFAEEKEEKIKEPKSKNGIDYYIDYLLEDGEERAQEALRKSAELGYIEDDSDKKTNAVMSDEYYFAIFCRYFEDRKIELLARSLQNGVRKGSMVAKYFVAEIFNQFHQNAYNHINFKKSLQYCKEASDKGFAPAQFTYATYIFKGLHGVKKDIPEAIRLFKESANQGYIDSQNELGCIYSGAYDDPNMPKNYKEAIEWWQKAIKQDYPISKYNLGIFYLKNKKNGEGFRLVKEAFEGGENKAGYNLGRCYIDGTGTSKDVIKGIKLVEEAAEQNVAEAIIDLATQKPLYDLLTKAEKYPKYYIRMNSDDITSIKAAAVRTDKIKELLASVSLAGCCGEEVYNGDWLGVKTPLPSNSLTKDVRKILAIDRVMVDKISPEQQQLLQLELPKATIEDVPDNVGKMFITWPIDEKVKIRNIIHKFIKSLEAQPRTMIAKPLAETMDISTTSQVK